MKGMPHQLRRVLRNKDRSLPAALAEVLKEKDHKYGAERTTCLYGHNHDSKKEAMWCIKLHELEKEGKISLLVREPLVVIKVNGIIICNHYPDFTYFDHKKRKNCILDVKGLQLPDWILKYKLCKAIYPLWDYEVV